MRRPLCALAARKPWSQTGLRAQPLDAGNAKVRLAQVTDPDGNVVTFAQDLIGH